MTVTLQLYVAHRLTEQDMALKSEADLQALFAQGWFSEISHLLRDLMSREDLSFLLTALEWLHLAVHALCDC